MLCQESIFMMMTSYMKSQGGLKVGPLYSFINEITTFFMIIKKRAQISSQNFLFIGLTQNRSNFEVDISPSIVELERRSKAQNIGNAHGFLSGIFNFQYNFR